MTVIAAVTVHTLSPVGWVAVGLALGLLGVLTHRLLSEAIGAEELSKIHMVETAIASNPTLHGSLSEIERVGYRLLDWTELRIYRVADAEHREQRHVFLQRDDEVQHGRHHVAQSLRQDGVAQGLPLGEAERLGGHALAFVHRLDAGAIDLGGIGRI